MDIRIKRSNLVSAISITQSIAQKKAPMPILINILISCKDGVFSTGASDLEVTAVTETPCEMKKPGRILVNSRLFSDLVKELPEGDVRIKVVENDRIEIIAGASKSKIVGLNADEYPDLAGVGLSAENRINAGQLLDMLNKTLYAVSVDETRFNLNGVLFQSEQEGKGKTGRSLLRLVSTDGHRLATVVRPMEVKEVPEALITGVILPRRGLGEIKKLLDNNRERDIFFGVSEGFFVFKGENTKIAIRIVDGQFPDYKQVFPKEAGTKVNINLPALGQALKRVSILAGDDEKGVQAQFGDGYLRIKSSSPDLGEADEEIQVAYKGEPLTIGFNANYLIDIANSLGSEEMVEVELGNSDGPAKFRSTVDESYTAIVMPMRL